MRLIDADALIEKHREVCSYSMKFNLDLAPTVDAVPVVRCCDCKYHHDCGTHFCVRLGMDCPDDSEFFCKYGARMDGDA